MAYVSVINRPNRMATVHVDACSCLGDHPKETASSSRRRFDDGFEALRDARSGMPQRFGLCRHCPGDLAESFTGGR